MKVKIEKGGLQLCKRLRSGFAPKILSAEIEEDDLSLFCRYNYDSNVCFRIDAYLLSGNWRKIPSEMRRSEEKGRKEIRLIISSCIPGTYKIEAHEMGVKSKLSYESAIVEN